MCPHLTPLPTTHFHSSLFSLLAGSLFFLSFSSFHFLSFLLTKTHTHTHTLPHSPAGLHSKPHHLTVIFSTISQEKYLRTPKHLYHFFEVKVLISFDGYYVLIWGYFTQVFIMIFMWFKSFEMIFICLYIWVLVLMDVFDEWVYDFYNDGYLRLVMVNIMFIDYLELVKYLNCLSWRKLWFWYHGSLDDVI